KCRFPVKCQNQHLIRRTLTTMQGVRNLAHHGGGFSGSRRSHQQLARRRCHRGHPLLVRQRGPLDGIKQGRILLEGAGKFVVRHACAITGCKGIRLTSCTNKQNWTRTSMWAGKPRPPCCYTLMGLTVYRFLPIWSPTTPPIAAPPTVPRIPPPVITAPATPPTPAPVTALF